jgi:hypothetical protein
MLSKNIVRACLPNVRCKFVCDEIYAVPTKDWLLGKFSKYYRRKLFGWGLWKWRPTFDCDDFASFFRALAHLAHAKSKNSGVEGITVGECWYRVSNSEAHAVNVALIDEGNTIILVYIEPQTCKIIEAPDNIYYIRM